MSQYFATNTPTAISETYGTIQNADHIYSVLVNDSASDDGGIILLPQQKFMWSDKTLYISKYDKTAPLDIEVRVIKAVSASGGGGTPVDVDIISQAELDSIIASIGD